MNDINLPIGTKVWPVVSRDANPDIRFPKKPVYLIESAILDPRTVYKVPVTPRFMFFMDGTNTLPSKRISTHSQPLTITNEPGKYAYYEFPTPKIDSANHETAHGFIFNMKKSMKDAALTKWELVPYFENEILHEDIKKALTQAMNDNVWDYVTEPDDDKF